MADLLRLRSRVVETESAYFESAKHAENRRNLEYNAVIILQRFVRGCLARKHVHAKLYGL